MRILIALLLLSTGVNAQVFPGMRAGVATKPGTVGGGGGTVVARFNFNSSAQSVVGWTDVSGNPGSAVVTATDPGGIGVSSVSTTKWSLYIGATSSNTGGESAGNTKFPSNVMVSRWYMYSTRSILEADANIQLTGLNPAKTYKLEFMCSRLASAVPSNPTLRTHIILWGLSGNSAIADIEAKGNAAETVLSPPSASNSTGIATFTGIVPKANGTINVRINPRYPTVAGEDFGYINGLIITEE
jgi:hypothetical protein